MVNVIFTKIKRNSLLSYFHSRLRILYSFQSERSNIMTKKKLKSKMAEKKKNQLDIPASSSHLISGNHVLGS